MSSRYVASAIVHGSARVGRRRVYRPHAALFRLEQQNQQHAGFASLSCNESDACVSNKQDRRGTAPDVRKASGCSFSSPPFIAAAREGILLDKRLSQQARPLSSSPSAERHKPISGDGAAVPPPSSISDSRDAATSGGGTGRSPEAAVSSGTIGRWTSPGSIDPSEEARKALMRRLQRAKDRANWQGARDLLHWHLKHEPSAADIMDVKVYTYAIGASAKAGKWKIALGIVDLMKSHGVQPNAVTDNAVINAYRKARQWEMAVELLREMQAKGTANGASYGLAIKACGKCGQGEQAVALLEELQAEDSPIPATVGHYNATIYALGNSENKDSNGSGTMWKRAVDMLDEMRTGSISVAPDSRSFINAIAACGKAGQGEEALRIFQNMRAAGDMVVQSPLAYSMAIKACGIAGDAAGALRLLKEMEADGVTVSPNVFNYNAAIEACGDAGKWEQAIGVLREMELGGSAVRPNVASYNSAILACGKCGQWEQAMNVFRDVLGKDISVRRTHAGTYHAAVQACRDSQQNEQVQALQAEMKERGIRPRKAQIR
ncbi:unnamed protein product [Sphacelaria rigidula]